MADRYQILQQPELRLVKHMFGGIANPMNKLLRQLFTSSITEIWRRVMRVSPH